MSEIILTFKTTTTKATRMRQSYGAALCGAANAPVPCGCGHGVGTAFTAQVGGPGALSLTNHASHPAGSQTNKRQLSEKPHQSQSCRDQANNEDTIIGTNKIFLRLQYVDTRVFRLALFLPWLLQPPRLCRMLSPLLPLLLLLPLSLLMP